MKRNSWSVTSAVVVALVAAATVALVGASSPARAADLPAVKSDARPPFTIGPGDQLEIHVFEDNSRAEVLVRPDGRITLPLAGDMDAEGLTPVELAAKVKTALEPFQKDPTVTVTVRTVNSYRIYLLGNVRTQGVFVSGAPVRLLQAIAMGGGFNEFANQEVVVLRDRKNGPTLRIPINTKKVIKGDALDLNIWLQPGDMVLAE